VIQLYIFFSMYLHETTSLCVNTIDGNSYLICTFLYILIFYFAVYKLLMCIFCVLCERLLGK